jgi:multisubunit Na+/H+ antiporter MnhE subunit
MANKDWLGGKLIAHASAAWVAFFSLYLLFTGTGKPPELAVGGVCGWLVAAFEMALRARSERPLHLTFRMLWPVIPAFGQLVLDAFRVADALLSAFRAPLSGEFCAIAVPPGTAVDSAAGRGIAIAAASLAPSSYVVDAGVGRSLLIVHRLAD